MQTVSQRQRGNATTAMGVSKTNIWLGRMGAWQLFWHARQAMLLTDWLSHWLPLPPPYA
jgi:hypothetical protein